MGKRNFILVLILAMFSLCSFSQDIQYAQAIITLPDENSEWYRLNEEIGRYVSKKDSSDIDHFIYDSHPQYEVSNDFYVFNKEGELVHCHNMPTYDASIRNFFISNVLIDDFEKDKGNSGLSEDELKEVESNISSIANYTFDFDGYGDTTSPVMNYISRLYLAKKNIFIEHPQPCRDGDTSFSFFLGKGEESYKLCCDYIDKGNFIVGKALKIVKGEKPNSNYVESGMKRGKVTVDPLPSPKNGNTLVLAEKMPSFNGNISSWLASHLQYPAVAAENGIEGRVIVRFVVAKDGSITNASIIKSVSPSLDGESLRVVRSMPKWNPGINKGKPAAVWFSLPVTFRLQ